MKPDTLDVVLRPFKAATPIPAQLTTDHPSSSYGRPVLLVDGEPLGPGDLLHRDGLLTLVAELEVLPVHGGDPSPLMGTWKAMATSYLQREGAR